MVLDYKKIGLKSGVEIHQQLDTSKLFCNCPSLLRQDEPGFKVERKLHVVAGEEGEIDVAAEFEAAREREFIYQGYDTTCLVELDECPPYPINQEALRMAIQISLLLNCEILSVSQIMRKTVIDGSNTSGFQRTILIARNGYVETESGRVGIENISLEEDAARIIGKREGKMVYRLDRLGIPLVEIGTAPDIKSPEQAREVALHIGEILRSCKVKRGIGTIRQDVNMSIKKGKRIEVKGVQEPRLIQKTIEIEAERQMRLVKEKKSKAEVRKAEPDGSTKFLRPLPGKARMYPETDLPLLKISKKMIDMAKKSLPRLKHDIRKELVKEGLNAELARLILQKDKLEEFKELLTGLKKPNLIAKMLVLWREEIGKHKGWKVEKTEEKLNTDLFEDILIALKQKTIEEGDVKRIMKEVAEGKKLEEALKKEQAEEVEEEIIKLLKEKPGLTEKAYMGILMAKCKGKISGKDLIELIRKHIK
jgi:Glu-tRNA(Gln) amidotransferase subunit E-like FAD-binding protein